ncbi:MAG: shikimate kinase [Candidatus Latescibacterota bacterium]|nr:shikimate kinase [Candidatus Latescibacterota bacterium]
MRGGDDLPGVGPIFLTGFMATGKSKVGRMLASRLQRTFVDTDDMIVACAGKAIPEIFAEDGENRFRELEATCVLEASQCTGIVVALGGGAVTIPANRRIIRDAGGVLVCLEAGVDTILERVSRKNTRPLMDGLNEEQKREKITAMLQERAPYYATADFTLQSSEEHSPERLVDELVDYLANESSR